MAFTRSINGANWLMALIAALVVSAFVSGCSISACPTIGWANTLTVRLEGATSKVSVVE
ncbi:MULTISPECIES: hypothetical protein [Cryobacterium]|uniref:hypothetical protein n=1 Tax=Cryobacterium TaxID=69578 RepID=UPI001304E002|nr:MULTISPECIES: hypothetical protein [Cryobacterium]